MGACWNGLNAAVVTSTHNLCFWAKIRKIMYTPSNPTLSYTNWGLRGAHCTDLLTSSQITSSGIAPARKCYVQTDKQCVANMALQLLRSLERSKPSVLESLNCFILSKIYAPQYLQNMDIIHIKIKWNSAIKTTKIKTSIKNLIYKV